MRQCLKERQKKLGSEIEAGTSSSSEKGGSDSRYCQIVLHFSGLVEIEGDKATVDALTRELEHSRFEVFWKYKSRCG